MELKSEQIKKAEEKLSKLLSGQRCLVCQGNEWILSDRLYELREFSGGGITLGQSSVFPVILVICKNCGNTLMFNAIQLELLEKKDGEK